MAQALAQSPACRQRVDRSGGFTLIELIVTLAVAGVLLSIGIPSFSRLVLDSRRSAAINDLVSTFHYARAEAISLRKEVRVCRSASGAADAVCASEGGWEQGWIVFVDDNGNALREPEEPLLRSHGALPRGVTLRGNTHLADAVSFRPHGGTTDNGRLAYCDRRGWSEQTRIVVVATTGRVRVTTPAADRNAALSGCMD